MSDFESGLELCLEEYRELASLSPQHELLKYGSVTPEDTIFYLDEEHQKEFDKRFAKDGVHPRGVNACAYSLGQYYVALRDAIKEIRSGQAAKTEN